MSDRKRIGIDAEFYEHLESFIEENPELGFKRPKDIMMQATREWLDRKDSAITEEQLKRFEKLADRIDPSDN